MSMLRAAVPRFASRSIAVSRRSLSTNAVGAMKPNPESAKEFISKREHAFEHAGRAYKANISESTNLWRKITLFGCIPGSIVLGIYMYQVESEHAHHHEHVLEENDGLPERPDYEYVNIKRRAYPWGQQTLFFNPKVNYPSPEM